MTYFSDSVHFFSSPTCRRPRNAMAMAIAAAAALSACGGGDSEAAATGVQSIETAAAPVRVEQPEAVQNTAQPGQRTANPVARATAAQSACDSATGPVLQVGPGKQYAKPSAAALAARSGDVIKIQAGTYRGDVATWKASNLTICGVGGRAKLYADGKSAGRKAIWVVSGSDITIEGIEFHHAAVPDRNGAGIRMEHKSGDLRIVNSGFFDNQNGILTTGGPVTLTIERSEFARNSNGSTNGQTHNLYVGAIDKLTVSASYFHGTRYGSNLKSRAKVSVVENSYLMDGASGPSSYLTDFSNGGKVVLRGNMFHKGPKAPNRVAIQHGAEGKRWTDNSLEMANNTVVMTRPKSVFLRVQPWAQSVTLRGNVFASTAAKDALISGSEFPTTDIVQQSNVVMRADAFPGAVSITSPNFWPTAAALPLTALQTLPDSSYTQDAPAPFTLRAIAGKPARAGALQSAR